jgi:hypothetical protein
MVRASATLSALSGGELRAELPPESFTLLTELK